MSDEGLRGKLLVAQPSLVDPNFYRAVVLVLQQNDEGAIGLILNRPSDVDAVEPLGDWAGLAAQPKVVFVGGPVVEENTAICLARVRRNPGAAMWKELANGIGTLDINNPVDPAVEEVRLFAGYAGWSAGQLETEIEVGGWFVLDAKPIDAFSADPKGLWKAVMARQRGMMAWFVNYPPDARLN